jgi:hypothetical protein
MLKDNLWPGANTGSDCFGVTLRRPVRTDGFMLEPYAKYQTCWGCVGGRDWEVACVAAVMLGEVVTVLLL